MNIFEVLSQGKGRLNEENLSAMLRFLLLPSGAHGLGDIFLRHFLGAVAKKCGEERRFEDIKLEDAAVLLEQQYNLGKKKRVIDVEIRIIKKVKIGDKDIEVHRIAIENKIKPQSATAHQLKEEFEYILHNLDDKETNITMVFLTPKVEHNKLTEEYEMLDDKTLGHHKKSQLYWSDQEGSKDTIAGLIKEILSKEAEAEIPPMTEYIRHTLKAFVRHLLKLLEKAPSPPPDWGIAEVVFVEINKNKYRIEKFKNATIRVVNLETQKYEPANTILEKIILQKDLSIDRYEEKNSRVLGAEVMDQLIRQGKNMKDT